MIIIPANTLSSGGYDVANSLRINSGDDCKLSRTAPNSSPTNADKFTISFWIKRSNIDQDSGHEHQQIFDTYDGLGAPYQEFQMYFTQNTLRIQVYNSSNQMELVTSRVFRDVSAWYSIIFSYDSSPSTPSSSSIRLWINGVQETSFSTETYPSQNVNGEFAIQNHIQMIGNNSANARDLGCYLAEFVGVDGQALINTDFGEFDEDSGIWKPIDVSGINVGTLGFYLDFENSSALGTDVSSVGNFTLANLAAIDQSTDTPTNNFATWNSLAKALDGTLSEGNLSIDYGSSATRSGQPATIGVSQGKWYWEVKASASSGGGNYMIGIAGTQYNSSSTASYSIGYYPGYTGQGYGYYASNGNVVKSDSAVVTLNTYATGDIIGIALDLDNDNLYFYKNGTIQNGGTAIDISSVTPDYGVWFPAVGDGSSTNTCTLDANFGNPPYTISSGNADGNGYGNFEYAVPSGYYSLNTKNLAEFG